jgi:hypothetical protein
MLISFSRLEDAAAAQAALAAAGLPAQAMRVIVRDDEDGPTAGDFIIGNGRTTHGGPPEAVRTGPEVPYDENFRDPERHGGVLLFIGELDAGQRTVVAAVLQHFDAVDVEKVADRAAPSAGDRTRDSMPQRGPDPAARAEQPPLGDHPDYDEILDVAVEYTFPCSDPIAVDSCCARLKERGSSLTRDTGSPGPGGQPQTTASTSRPR